MTVSTQTAPVARQDAAEGDGSGGLRLLTLDVATVTGWAANCLGGHVEAGTQEFALRRGESAGMRYLRFRLWLQGQLAALQPEVVVYEAPVSHHPGAHAAEVAYALVSRVQEECEVAGLDCVGLAPTALKRYATGKGVAEKSAMIAAAARRFPEQYIADDHQADALLLLAWALDGFPEQERRVRRAARRAAP